jgi:hypothetical protein
MTTQPRSHLEAKWILWIGCGLRVAFFPFSQNKGGDAFSSVAVTANWLKHPSLNLDFGGPTSRLQDNELKCGPTSNIEF